MKLELFPEVKLLARAELPRLSCAPPPPPTDCGGGCEQRIKEIGASRTCTGSGLSSGRQDLPVGCGRCHPCWVGTTELSPGTDAPAPPHTQTQGQPSWVWAPYGLQNCPHPRLMEGGRLLWCAGLCVFVKPHMHLSVWAHVCVCVSVLERGWAE